MGVPSESSEPGPPAWPPTIDIGPELELRRWSAADAPALSAAVTANVEHLRPWMPWIADEPASPEARLRVIAEWEAGWQAGTDRHFGIFDRAEAVGSVALMARIGPGGLEIGYWLDRAHMGRGIATAAADTVTSLALAAPGIDRVEIHHDQANTASAGIPRRLGFALVGEVAVPAAAPGESGVDCIWRMTSGRWHDRPGTPDDPARRRRP